MRRRRLIVAVVAIAVVLMVYSVGEASPGVIRDKTFGSAVETAPKLGNLTEDGRIVLSVRDNLSGVDPATIYLTVNGCEVAPSLSAIPRGYRICCSPCGPGAPSSEYRVELRASDRAGNWMRQAYRFVSAARPVALEEPQSAPQDLGPLAARPQLETVVSDAVSATGQWALAQPLRPGADIGHGPLQTVGQDAARLFDVSICDSSRIPLRIENELRKVSFDVRCSGIIGPQEAQDDYELFIGLIEPGGQVVFYEPQVGRRGIRLSELTPIRPGWFRLELSFEPASLASGYYVWCAAVARVGAPQSVVSNVASTSFDVAPPTCAAEVGTEPSRSPGG